MVYQNPWENYTNIMKALSDQTRMKIIWLLCNIDSKICSSEIAEVLEENPYNISRHIKILKNTNLVYEKKEGTRIYYYYNPGTTGFDSAVREMIMQLPSDMMSKEVERCKNCLKKRQ